MDNIFDTVNKLIETDKINSLDEFNVFIVNLTNHPDPLREACAYKLEELFDEKYLSDFSLEIILNAISDINPNVSRSVCKVISDNLLLQSLLEEKIIKKIIQTLDKISDEDKTTNTKSHAKNKALFSLYWLMEALSECVSEKFTNDIVKILHSTSEFRDYTIREKTAKILSKMKHKDKDLVNQLNSDTNFYVNFYTKFI